MMVKIIWKEPKEDDPIFRTGFIISNPKLNFNKKRKGDKKWKNYLFSQFLEIKQGKKLLKW